ncbi:hypothetical protein Btru_027746 [Bulinus truncatus]|nr:hypothetical protein Btru_027746 [Bulinus truncatus]
MSLPDADLLYGLAWGAAMRMVGKLTQSSSVNSFSSICYCVLALGVHGYSCYSAILRYKESESRAWPGGGGGTPSEAAMLLGFTVLSIMLMPMLCMTSFIKVGNLANDGVKLGRDHALGCHSDTAPRECGVTSAGMARVWKHFCPISQTLHVVAAFLLLLPETFLTAVEIKFGYKAAGEYRHCGHFNFQALLPKNKCLAHPVTVRIPTSVYQFFLV